MATLTARQIAEAELTGWVYLRDALHARLDTKDFATGLRLVNRIGEAAEAANHHPDVDLRYPHVDVTLTSHDVGGVTVRDVEMARTITGIAQAEGVEVTPPEATGL